jgi:8-oxo-dGTP pyrophosphatase MutT (NUDIX family)
MSELDPADVPVRPAATVVLLRDGERGQQVWLQQRAASLVFAGGMYAFPGGAVDDDDARVGAELIEVVDLTRHAQAWDHDLQWSATLLAAACRETFEEAGVQLAPEQLVPWSRWITPVGSPRRFDAHFFVVPLPEDLTPRPLTSEVAGARWHELSVAVEQHRSGALPMWPPTITTLLQLAPYDCVADVLAGAPRQIRAFRL